MRYLRVLAVATVVAAVCAGSDFAERLYKAGQRAERQGDTLHAYLLYTRAAALDPANATFAARKAALRPVAEIGIEDRLDPEPAAESPSGTLNNPAESDLAQDREALPPPELAGSLDKESFDLKGDARIIFEKVAGAYGLGVVFDPDFQAPPPFTFRMTDVEYPDALRALETVANSFVVPVNPKLMVVARDTPQKRTQMAQATSIAIPIPERISTQDAQEIVAAVQGTLELRRIGIDPLRRMVILRDQAGKIQAARRMFAILSRLRPQVEIDVELLEVDKNSSLAYGLSLPNSFSLVNFGDFLHNASHNSASIGSFTNFLSFGGGATYMGLGITAATAFATVSRSSTENLLDAQIVSLDGQAATLHVGQRYPVVTNGYYGTVPAGSGTVYTPPPTISFQDLGLTVKVTPTVHDNQEVTLDLDTQFSLLGANSGISGIPIISNRQFTGKVRLKEGEWAVVAGLVQLSNSDIQNGVAGLASIPLLGRLFFSKSDRVSDSSDVLLVLKPHLTTLPPWENVSPPIWVGTETRPITLF